jgi:predicted DNA-binding transcriptional regulator AlpA
MQTLIKLIDVARRYGISRQTLYDWINKYNFPKPLKLGGLCYYKPEMVEEWESCQAATKGRRTRTAFHD